MLLPIEGNARWILARDAGLGEAVVRDYGGRGRAYVCTASDGASELA